MAGKISSLVLASLGVAAAIAIAVADVQAAPRGGRVAGLEQQAEAIIAAEADLRAQRSALSQCADGCLTPSEAVATAFAAGSGKRVKGRFLLEVRGAGVSPNWDPERYFFLNSEQDYRVFGCLTLAIEPETMKRLLNPPRVDLRAPLEEGDIVVERDRPQQRVVPSISNIMKKFKDRRLIIDGEVELKWIRYVGTQGRDGFRGEGYYQVWVRIDSPDQVTIPGEAAAD